MEDCIYRKITKNNVEEGVPLPQFFASCTMIESDDVNDNIIDDADELKEMSFSLCDKCIVPKIKNDKLDILEIQLYEGLVIPKIFNTEKQDFLSPEEIINLWEEI